MYMFKTFKQPYPFAGLKERIVHTTIIAVFVYFFLAILEPFDLNKHNPENKDWIILGYGINIFLMLVSKFSSTSQIQISETPASMAG